MGGSATLALLTLLRKICKKGDGAPDLRAMRSCCARQTFTLP